ncbi:PilZ domain-containing protein [Halobacteriovorax sp.]|uniref:PilZ domain-containing protein n=1 Tax=Halobacteriovorax sp. TaxID=2020862 RepID=UPI003565CBC6
MTKRPTLLIFTCLVMIGIIISIPLQILAQTEVTAINYNILLQQITVFNWLVMISCFMTMMFAINGHKLLPVSVIFLLLSIHINNYFVFKYAVNIDWYIPLIASCLSSILAFSFLLNKNIRYTANNQDKRWWLIPKRHQKTLPIWIVLDDSRCVLAHTFDLSKTGTFISTIDGLENKLQSELELGRDVKILIGDKDDIEFHCNASVVRKTQAKGNYPSGIGLHFHNIPIIEKFHLSRILNNPSLGL